MMIHILAMIGAITLGRWLYHGVTDLLDRPMRKKRRYRLHLQAQFKAPETHAIARQVMRREKHG